MPSLVGHIKRELQLDIVRFAFLDTQIFKRGGLEGSQATQGAV